jgi:hypothetical protein
VEAQRVAKEIKRHAHIRNGDPYMIQDGFHVILPGNQ